MKSNEEFIAGIYKKAAVYTEEKEIKAMKTNWVAKVTKIAAMAVVCIGLAGAGILVFGTGDHQKMTGTPELTGEDYGIALTSELDGDEANIANGVAQCRIGPVAETVTFTGVVEEIDAKENRIWLKLEFEETAPEYTVGSMACIKWDMLEKISEEISAGTKLTATGALSTYENEVSEYNGCAELVLTDIAKLEIEQ